MIVYNLRLVHLVDFSRPVSSGWLRVRVHVHSDMARELRRGFTTMQSLLLRPALDRSMRRILHAPVPLVSKRRPNGSSPVLRGCCAAREGLGAFGTQCWCYPWTVFPRDANFLPKRLRLRYSSKLKNCWDGRAAMGLKSNPRPLTCTSLRRWLLMGHRGSPRKSAQTRRGSCAVGFRGVPRAMVVSDSHLTPRGQDFTGKSIDLAPAIYSSHPRRTERPNVQRNCYPGAQNTRAHPADRV